jgi:CDP-paratose 2-epimerase
VHAGYGEDPGYLVNSNLIGSINCLEFLRKNGGNMVFLSTSRVYPIAALRQIPLVPQGSRLILEKPMGVGLSAQGIAEDFSLLGNRSLYGATKLCSELLIQEYSQLYGIKAIINRCGVLAGPWQMGKVDQGFIALWVARHIFGGKLQYSGFGGEGLQVRDVLHVQDLCTLLALQMANASLHTDHIYNVGGGINNSISLRELTNLVQQITGKQCPIEADPITKDHDIPFYISDNSKIFNKTQWQPQISLPTLIEETTQWMIQEKDKLSTIFGG